MRIALSACLAVASYLALGGSASAQTPGPQPPGPITVTVPQTSYAPSLTPPAIQIGNQTSFPDNTPTPILVTLAAPTNYAFQWSDSTGWVWSMIDVAAIHH